MIQYNIDSDSIESTRSCQGVEISSSSLVVITVTFHVVRPICKGKIERERRDSQVKISLQLVTKFSALELKAYGKAGNVAEEVLSSIRTVFSYNGQEREQQRFILHWNKGRQSHLPFCRYEKHLEEARRSAIKKGAVDGFTAGAAWCLIYCTYPLGIYPVVLHANAKVMRTLLLGFWYGTKLVRDGEYTIGAVNMVSVRRLDR